MKNFSNNNDQNGHNNKTATAPKNGYFQFVWLNCWIKSNGVDEWHFWRLLLHIEWWSIIKEVNYSGWSVICLLNQIYKTSCKEYFQTERKSAKIILIIIISLAMNVESACARCCLQRGLQRNYRKERDWKDCIVCTAYFWLVNCGFRSNSSPQNKVCFPANITAYMSWTMCIISISSCSLSVWAHSVLLKVDESYWQERWTQSSVWVFLGHPNQFFLSKMNERTVIIVVGFWSSLLVWQEMIFLLFLLVIINLHHLINAPYSWIMRSPGQKKWWLTDSTKTKFCAGVK